MKSKDKALTKMKVKHSKPMGVTKETTLSTDWKKGKKFKFHEQN